MFNKGKPYVPPPTRSMGSANAHDGLHDLDDAELELDSEIHPEPSPAPRAAYSHAAEERMAATPQDNVLHPEEHASDVDLISTQTQTHASADDSWSGGRLSSGGYGSGGGSGGGGHGGSGAGGGHGGGSTPANPTREAASVLANGMTFEGDISGVGQLVIEGVVKGDIRVSQVLINEKGTVEGTVHADQLDVRGRIAGAIVAKQVRLHPTSRVEGDITQEQITIERGAWFSGRSTQAKRGDELVEAD